MKQYLPDLILIIGARPERAIHSVFDTATARKKTSRVVVIRYIFRKEIEAAKAAQ